MLNLWGIDEEDEIAEDLAEADGLTKSQEYGLRWKAWSPRYQCQTCHHNITGNCENSSDGSCCAYWYSEESRIKGIAYN